MTALLEKSQVLLANFVCGHLLMDLGSYSAALAGRAWIHGTLRATQTYSGRPTILEAGERLREDGRGDRAMPDDRVACIQTRDLAGGGALDPLRHPHLQALVRAGRRRALYTARHPLAAVAHLHTIHACTLAVQHDVAHTHAAGKQLLARADRDGDGAHVDGNHIARRPATEAEGV